MIHYASGSYDTLCTIRGGLGVGVGGGGQSRFITNSSLVRRTVCRVCTDYDSGEISGRVQTDDLRKSRGLHSVSAYGHGPIYMGLTFEDVKQHLTKIWGLLVSRRGEDDRYDRFCKRQKRHQKCRSNTH